MATHVTVRGSRSGRPIMVLLDLLGRRWSLRVLWELRERALTSRELRVACDEVSPTVLQSRLGELRAAGLVALQTGEGYRLTALGIELMTAFAPLYQFADRWADRRDPLDS
jgi:DNA-binding HxlR family transcriptional regulator